MSGIYLNPFVAMLYNAKLLRWHPVIFLEKPLPGGTGPTRHKSSGHHTIGFADRQTALAEVDKIIEGLGGAEKCIDSDIPWNGEGIPALTAFFIKNKEEKWQIAF